MVPLDGIREDAGFVRMRRDVGPRKPVRQATRNRRLISVWMASGQTRHEAYGAFRQSQLLIHTVIVTSALAYEPKN